MKLVFNLLIILTICYANLISTKSEFSDSFENSAYDWKTAHIDTLSDTHHLEILIDMILLSYQITKESCHMVKTKLIIQEELLKIQTPSISDSWQTNMKVCNNDTTQLEHAIDSIKKSQTIFQEIFNKLQTVGPHLILIDPQPIKKLITDLKTALITWGKRQHEITTELGLIQNEFMSAIATISDIKILFETAFHTSSLKHNHLKKAAGCVTKTYKDIEGAIGHLTKVRKDSIDKLELLFSLFFKTYYSIIFQSLTSQQKMYFVTKATPDGKLPLPDAFFI